MVPTGINPIFRKDDAVCVTTTRFPPPNEQFHFNGVSATVMEDTAASSKTVKVALAKAGDALLCYSGKQIISQLILPHVSDINKPHR